MDSDDFNKEDEDPHKVPEVDVMGMDVLSPNQEMLELDEDRLSNYRSHPKNIKGTTMSPPLKRGRRPITSIPTPQTGIVNILIAAAFILHFLPQRTFCRCPFAQHFE